MNKMLANEVKEKKRVTSLEVANVLIFEIELLKEFKF